MANATITVGLFTRYILENPYPVAIVLGVLAAGFAWSALRTGLRSRLAVAAGAAGVAVVVLVAGLLVVTSGERARRVVLEVVAAAEAADVDRAGRCFADDATLAFGSPRNPGLPREAIERRLDHLDGRYRIASNTITGLRAYTQTRDRAEVHLGCRTTTVGGLGPVPTQWVVTVERRPDGTWKITRATWVSIAGRSPGTDLGG